MEVQELISLLLGLITACIGFFLKRMIRELDDLKAEVSDLRRATNKETARIRDTYVKYEDFVRLQTSIDGKLSQIYELLAGGGR